MVSDEGGVISPSERPSMTLSDIARQVIFSIAWPIQPTAEAATSFARKLQADFSAAGHEGKAIFVWWPKSDIHIYAVMQFDDPAPSAERSRAIRPDVGHAYNQILGQAGAPDDPGYSDQWDLNKISAEAAWECAATLDPPNLVTVAVIDSGVSVLHPDLNMVSTSGLPRIFGQRVLVSPTDDKIEDEDGHGTFLAGTIAAVSNNSLGVASATAPIQSGLRLMAVKFYDPLTPMTAALAHQAITWAVDNGASVINASFHIGMNDPTLLSAVAYAAANDRVFVAAAGNDGTSNDDLPTWPASYALPNVISVMASNRHDDKPGFSNYGPLTVHLAAPGVRIWSTHFYLYPTNEPKWRTYSGTSASAAEVAAAAALIRAYSPNMTAPEVVQHLISAAHPNHYFPCVARGRLDLHRALCGPLAVVAPHSGQSFAKGSIIQVQWTEEYDSPGCATFDILLSRNGGATYADTLAAQVDSSVGSWNVMLPNVHIPHAKIKLATHPGQFPARSGLFKVH